jgi:hypothetical protein
LAPWDWTRTSSPLTSGQVLFQLSYQGTQFWSGQKDLNLRPWSWKCPRRFRLPRHNFFPFRNHRIHNFGTMLSPYTFSAHTALPINRHRVVSCYALFKGWLLLSQPPTCLRQCTSLSLSIDFGTLIDDLGCYPRDHEASPSRSHWHGLHKGIRSLFGRSTLAGTTNQSVLYPLCYSIPLSLKTFRGEPAITKLDKLFTTNHNSSRGIERPMGSGLQLSFDNFHPGHG